jgi:pimeloyl-ACP methyl ester carboxylesterase
MIAKATELIELDAQLKAHTTTVEGLFDVNLDFPSASIVEDPAQPAPGDPQVVSTWWGPQMNVWRYTVNGGHVIIMRLAGTGGGQQPVPILVKTFENHFSEFSPAPFVDNIPFTAIHWNWNQDGAEYILETDEQALADGAIVMSVKENFSADHYTTFQRCQEALHFLEHHDASQVKGVLGPEETLGNVYLYGGSWGAMMSIWLALLQPGSYAAAGQFGPNDIGYFMSNGDFQQLFNHRRAATGDHHPEVFHSNGPLSDLLRMVDILQCRFDDPGPGQQPWDVALLGANHRPADLVIPVYGFSGDEDIPFSWSWQASNFDLPHFHGKIIKNLEHGGYRNQIPGKNEVHLFDGTEWATLKMQAASTQPNNELVPPESFPVLANDRAVPDP